MGDCFDAPDEPVKKKAPWHPDTAVTVKPTALEKEVKALSSKVSCVSGLITFFVLAVLAMVGGALAVIVYSRDEIDFLKDKSKEDPNPCAGAKVDIPNAACAQAITDQVEQSGREVTAGFTAGDIDNSATPPITTSYKEAGLCAVNVHWHLGAEHKSAGEYDENGDGPDDTWAKSRRRLAAGGVREGMQCGLYDSTDAKYTTDYAWKYCEHMKVGQTYEVHWPHSSVGDCNTEYQFQTPFYDGVFCNFPTGGASTHDNVGVQAQVFTIVNDEDYYVPNLIEGMLVYEDISFHNGIKHTMDTATYSSTAQQTWVQNLGVDMSIYTGSTTGTTRDADTVCSFYSPITWQVDRKCHMISASSFDKMCYDMIQQADDMSDDLYPHGARELVVDSGLITPQE